jgi:hypothetical protein
MIIRSPARPMKKPSRNLLNLTLAGLDELDLFPSDEERQAAIDAVAGSRSGLASPALWLGIATCGFVALAAMLLSRVAIRPLLASLVPGRAGGELVDIVHIGFVMGATFLVMRWLHRRGAAALLRRRLLGAGVPVCVRCGYHLRGLGTSARACPECGRALDGEVQTILGRSE